MAYESTVMCGCGCEKTTKPGNRFLHGHSGTPRADRETTCRHPDCERTYHVAPSRRRGHGIYCCRRCWALDQRTGWISDQGYRWITVDAHPNANPLGQIAEHRYVMAEHLGRSLAPFETVHHRNGVTTDNVISNLELRIGWHPRGGTIEEAVEWAREILRLHDPAVLR